MTKQHMTQLNNPGHYKRLDDLREIAVVIDNWDDVFSDFDPSPLNVRTVSGDFIEELKKRYTETRSGNFIIKIYAPIGLQSQQAERMVKQRLKKHFNYIYLLKQKTVNGLRLRGVIFICVGIISLTFLTVATYYNISPNFLSNYWVLYCCHWDGLVYGKAFLKLSILHRS